MHFSFITFTNQICHCLFIQVAPVWHFPQVQVATLAKADWPSDKPSEQRNEPHHLHIVAAQQTTGVVKLKHVLHDPTTLTVYYMYITVWWTMLYVSVGIKTKTKKINAFLHHLTEQKVGWQRQQQASMNLHRTKNVTLLSQINIIFNKENYHWTYQSIYY